MHAISENLLVRPTTTVPTTPHGHPSAERFLAFLGHGRNRADVDRSAAEPTTPRRDLPLPPF